MGAPGPRPRGHQPVRMVEWEVKVTKLCNLRCAYCYEFEELGDPRRLSLGQWRSIFEGALWYERRLAASRPSGEVASRFIWHGGESSLLPLDYYRDVLALQADVLGPRHAPKGGAYANHAPTNLYSVRQDLLDFWDAEDFVLAVSYDGVAGARVTAGGAASEARVAENLRRLLANPRTVGLNTVLTAYNQAHLIDVYEWLKDLVQASPGTLFWNVIPAHSTAAQGRTAAFHLTEDAAIGALVGLFRHWLDDPSPLSITPLQQYYLAAARKLLRLPRLHFARRSYGETSLMVNMDGHVYLSGDTYERERTLGCLFEQPLEELMRSPRYAASLDRHERLTDEVCGGCPWDGHCNHAPLVNGHWLERRREAQRPGCALANPLLAAIEAEMLRRGVTAEVLAAGAWERVPRVEFLLQRPA